MSTALNTYTRSLNCIGGFSVLSWNVLAEGFFTKEQFPQVEYIPWKERLPLIKQYLRRYDAGILGLYEVDYADEYSDFLEKEGYLVHYSAVKKRTFKDTMWGVMVAVKAKQWKVLDYDMRMYADTESHQYWVLKLQDIRTNNLLNVVSTHLIAKAFNEQKRIGQAKQLAEVISQLNAKQPEVPIIVMGDFNAEPTYESYKLLRELPLQDKTTLQSVYGTDQWTTCKQRQTLELRTIDHMLYSRLNLVALENPPCEKQIVVKGLPDRQMPSDHLPLYALFTFK